MPASQVPRETKGSLLHDAEAERRGAGGFRSRRNRRVIPVEVQGGEFLAETAEVPNVDQPCAGTPDEPCLLNGPLFSVNPIALRRRLAYLWENKRVLTEFVTANLGTVLIIEVGATNVGSIVQTMTPHIPVAKGDEKGCFRFGGSSTITLFEPGKITLAPDLASHSAEQIELYARIGDVMGRANNVQPSAHV